MGQAERAFSTFRLSVLPRSYPELTLLIPNLRYLSRTHTMLDLRSRSVALAPFGLGKFRAAMVAVCELLRPLFIAVAKLPRTLVSTPVPSVLSQVTTAINRYYVTERFPPAFISG